ncbi:MAG: hypothetical protein KC615_15760 [Anaerolineae bacterium]|nr:hypothetical protein [Anaerolineae bacterium]
MTFLWLVADVYFRPMDTPIDAPIYPTRRTTYHHVVLMLFGAIVLLIASACQPTPATSLIATDIPFPTMTPGQLLSGRLIDQSGSGASPAEAIAQINRATPTPNFQSCPAQTGNDDIPDEPNSGQEAIASLLSYLDEGGTFGSIGDVLNAWDALGEQGYVRDGDLTGEGQPELVVGFTAPGNIGTLVVFGCENGHYGVRYDLTSEGSAPPVLVWLGDVNQDLRSEMVTSRRVCESADLCIYDTQILRWDAARGRFLNILNEPVRTLDVPRVADTDNDTITELVVELDTRGNTATGPLRTGVNIYDWNGGGYTLSIIQLDSPEYYIQYIHQADRLFAEQNLSAAARLYDAVLNDENLDLRYWFNDGPQIITTYALYRLTLAYAYLEDPRLSEVVARINTDYPVEPGDTADDQPVYIALAYTFMNTMQARSDLHTACESVQRIIEVRPQALDLLNRYGRYNPTYEALDLCPY